MLHLRDRHRCLLGCGRRKGNARMVQIPQQITHTVERLRIKIVVHVAFPVTRNQVRAQLSRITQVAKRVPQGRANIGTKALIIWNLQSKV